MVGRLGMLNREFLRHLINVHTRLSKDHMTPELTLHLITPSCHLWHAPPHSCPFDDPFWAFYWPGGQVLTRFILDNKVMFEKKRILDIGSGCGSAAIASAMCGAAFTVANDIDPVAEVAIQMNIEVNKVTNITTNAVNYLTTDSSAAPGGCEKDFDVILMGDMFYDPDFTHLISEWFTGLGSSTSVLIGDPGRLPFTHHQLKSQLECLAKYDLGRTCQLENNGLTDGAVWLYRNSR